MHQGYQNSGAPDLGHLQATMQAIELACSSIQMHVNPAAAEATILSLCQSARPYQTCQFILENSQVPNARFQAAAAIRDAALREWGFLTADDKRSLSSFCLCYVMQHASSPEGYVQAKVSSVAAQLIKRGWLDFTVAERESFFHEVKQAITGSHGLDVQFSGINFLESLVSEFSPSTSTAMGLPREFHEKCHMSIEIDYLKMFYRWAQEAAGSVTSRILQSNSAVPEVKVCTAALRLMLQILNWDFRYSPNSVRGAKKGIDVFSAGIRQENNLPRRSECTLVQPGPAWRNVLISSGHIGWVLSLYGALRQKFSHEGYWLDCPIAVAARKLIVQFCSLTGVVFPSDNGQSQGQLLLQLLSEIINWIDPPDAISQAIACGKSESEMLDGCRALLAISTVTPPLIFDQLLKSMRPFGTLYLLSALMCEVVKDLMANHTEEETWSWVARDILLDTWTAILVPTSASSQDILLPPEGINAAASLFSLIVESELKVATASVSSDEGEYDYLQASIAAMDERLSSYALIARAAIDVTVPLLTRLFSERFSRLQQVIVIPFLDDATGMMALNRIKTEGRGISNLIETLEELYSLLLIAGHVLADGGQGETPMVPNAIQTQFIDATETDKHPVVILSGMYEYQVLRGVQLFIALNKQEPLQNTVRSIIRFAEQSLDPDMRGSFFSPQLMEAVIWFLARWSSTYLMPPEESKETKSFANDLQPISQSQLSKRALLNFCGEHNQGKVVLDIIVRVCKTALVSYPGEKDLQELTCYQLLHGLVRRKSVCTHLIGLDSWQDLANTFANERTFFSLNGAHQRSLAQTLVLSASGMKNLEDSNQYVRILMGHMTAYLLEISSKNDLKSVAQQPDVIHLVSCLLERLRGAASASEPRSQKAIYEIGFSVLNPILVFLEVYKHESAVVYLLLKFVISWVDGQIIYLEAQETAVVINFCMRLLQLYSSHNIGKISLSLSSSLLSEAITEKYKDLRALLQLLASLCSKDLVDFSSDSIETHGTSISQVVFLGLHIVTPLITLDLLKYPKLCHDYFSLLSHMLEVYPEMVAQLNSDAFFQILGTLDFGLHHQDIEVVDMCLRALKALASFHYKESATGKAGLGSHAVDYKDPEGKLQEGILSRFLRSLLQFLLFEDYSTDLVSSAADALLSLILCERGLYQKLGNELIERQGDPTLKTRLANAFELLTSSNNLSSTLDRINYQKFRKNLQTFLIEVRGFLRTM